MAQSDVHLQVDDLAKSIGFYSELFAAESARLEGDFAKWMCGDPPVKFAIPGRGSPSGIDHLDIQGDYPAELAAMEAGAEEADMALVDEGEYSCRYARSEAHRVTDPQGIAWEHFHTLGGIAALHETTGQVAGQSACCAPTPRGKPIGVPVKSSTACC